MIKNKKKGSYTTHMKTKVIIKNGKVYNRLIFTRNEYHDKKVKLVLKKKFGNKKPDVIRNGEVIFDFEEENK